MEAAEALCAVGFVQRQAMPEDSDDEAASTSAPCGMTALEGATRHIHLPNARTLPAELCSRDEDLGSAVGFECVQDVMRRVFYARLSLWGEEGTQNRDALGAAVGRSMKSAITTLLDVAEACNSRKIMLGLGPEDAQCAEFVCSLLYLGFQVVPSRKAPLTDVALLLEFDIGLPWTGGPSSSDNPFTGTSNCSTHDEEVNGDSNYSDHDSD